MNELAGCGKSNVELIINLVYAFGGSIYILLYVV